jgi:hypothetical protein
LSTAPRRQGIAFKVPWFLALVYVGTSEKFEMSGQQFLF